MTLVMKFGGSSLADTEKIKNAVRLILGRAAEGNRVAVVVSAQGDCTDTLAGKAHALSSAPPGREMDALLAAGEQMSAALVAIALEQAGQPAVSLAGWQAGIATDNCHREAKLAGVDTARLAAELDAGRVAVVAGFQGVDRRGNITTLGRGGSDTTAVALAAALEAEQCLIYTDVSGIFTADPRLVRGAARHETVSGAHMLALAERGAQVLHTRAVALAIRQGVAVTVLSSFESGAGTRLVPDGGTRAFTAVTADRRWMLPTDAPPDSGAERPSPAEGMAGSDGRAVWVVPGAHAQPEGRAAVRVSVVGDAAGSPRGAARLSQALAAAGVPVLARASGPLWTSALVPPAYREVALQAVHDGFFVQNGRLAASGGR